MAESIESRRLGCVAGRHGHDGRPFPCGQAAIAGLATFGIGEAPRLPSRELAAQAGLLAAADAGLPISTMDALFICLPNDPFAGLSLAEYCGLQPRFTYTNRTGGSSFVSYIITASLMIAQGYIHTALIAYGSNLRSAGGKLATPAKSAAFEAPHNPLYPLSSYALAAARQRASTNPEAFAKGPLSIENCSASRIISSPIRKLDCCLVTNDGTLSGQATVVPRSLACV